MKIASTWASGATLQRSGLISELADRVIAISAVPPLSHGAIYPNSPEPLEKKCGDAPLSVVTARSHELFREKHGLAVLSVGRILRSRRATEHRDRRLDQGRPFPPASNRPLRNIASSGGRPVFRPKETVI